MLIKKIISTSGLLFFFSQCVITQVPITTELSPVKTTLPLGYTFIGFTSAKEAITGFQNIPKGMDSYELFSFETQRSLRFFKYYKAGKVSKSNYLKFQEANPLDTTFFLNNKVRTQIHCLSGFKGGSKIMIVDANNNFDFGDDRIFEFDTSSYFIPKNKMDIEKLPEIEVSFEVYDGKKVFQRNVFIRLLPYSNVPNYSGPSANWYRIVTPHLCARNLGATIEFNHVKYCVALNNMPSSDLTLRHNLVICPDSEKNVFQGDSYHAYRTGDTLNVEGNSYLIKPLDLSNNELTLVPLENVQLIGTRPGMHLPMAQFRDVQNSLITSNSFLGKPTIIDFWGSWCGPCIKEIPSLRSLWTEYRDKINVLSLAFDDDPEEAKRLIQELGMDWSQVILPRQNEESQAFLRKWKIDAFPTMLLLDQKGIVRDKVVGIGGSERLHKQLEQLLKEH
jgi:thiol-disulfide isomerase/thioredoxin